MNIFDIYSLQIRLLQVVVSTQPAKIESAGCNMMPEQKKRILVSILYTLTEYLCKIELPSFLLQLFVTLSLGSVVQHRRHNQKGPCSNLAIAGSSRFRMVVPKFEFFEGRFEILRTQEF